MGNRFGPQLPRGGFGSSMVRVGSAATVAAVGALLSARAAEGKPIMVNPTYGTVDGQQVSLYTLTNARGMVVKVTNYGGIITEIHVPDKAGKMADVALGFDSLE